MDSEQRAPHWTIHKRMNWPGSAAFVACHLAIFGAIYSGVTWQAAVACVVLIFVRLWGVTAGYHRYFSHRTFKTSRVFQFILAFLAQSSAQKGALWWAAHHRRHHKHSDQEGDLHSPVREGFWYSHLGWLFVDGSEITEYDRIRDFARYPELVWLNKFHLVPPTLLAVGLLYWLGLPGLFIGFFLSTVLLWHITFTINSLAHVYGKRRFETTDDSRNSMFLGLLTLGEGWHNNHHRYQSSARNGFYWWEIDVTYYVLKMLSWVGIVWNLRPVPEKVLAEGRRRDREAKEPTTTPTTPPPKPVDAAA
ncbi:MAG: acyl-CoA desaturase [Myxococcota bacterium]